MKPSVTVLPVGALVKPACASARRGECVIVELERVRRSRCGCEARVGVLECVGVCWSVLVPLECVIV